MNAESTGARGHRPVRTTARRAAWGVLALLGLGLGAIVIGALLSSDGPSGDPGELTETARPWTTDDGPLPVLADATSAWGLDSWSHDGTIPASGGVTITDLDRDGRSDLVLAAGNRTVMFGGPTGFQATAVPGRAPDATSVAADDLDQDGNVDLLFGHAGHDDIIVWGGEWLGSRDARRAETTELPGGEPTTGLLVAELTGDRRLDIVRLGYGPGDEGAPDVVWEQSRPRTFVDHALPASDRLSLAAELADVDRDGLVDIWVTRDLGWAYGGDSLYTRNGDASGRWRDDAHELGVALEVDGMGVTVADLDADGHLDGYISDLGDNEVLVGTDTGFTPASDTGAARIRPPDVGTSLISSSWASGVADLNLDGHLDLVVANGGFDDRQVANKIADTEIALDDPPSILLGHGDGTYSDVWADLELDWSGSSRGMALGDLDADGDTDIVVINHGGGLRALRNDTRGPSIAVALDAACAAGGVEITATTETGRVTAMLGPHAFLGAHARELVVGAQAAEILVTRPGGGSQSASLGPEPPRSRWVPTCPSLTKEG